MSANYTARAVARLRLTRMSGKEEKGKTCMMFDRSLKILCKLITYVLDNIVELHEK